MDRTLGHFFLYCAFLAGGPVAVTAQSASLPIIGSFVTDHLNDNESRYAVTRIAPPGRDTTPIPFASWTTVRHLKHEGGKVSIERVSTFAMSGATIVDSMKTWLPTMQPIQEVSHQPSKTMHLGFDGANISGSVRQGDSTLAISAKLPVAVFNSTDSDLLITSLPMREGYAGIVPTYVFESGGLVVDTVHVQGQESVTIQGQPRRAWRVESRGPTSVSTYWVEADSRILLRRDVVQRRDGSIMRMVLVP